jgi:hypothetical protein
MPLVEQIRSSGQALAALLLRVSAGALAGDVDLPRFA